MVFSSLTFLLLFLPAALLLYYAAPRKLKNGVLFLCSLVFYAWGEPVYVCIMLFSTVLDYTCGRLVERYRGTKKQKIGLIVSICVNVGLLAFFKYTDFFIGTVNSVFGAHIGKPGLPLPIGISFYTFQTMSYTVDVYRGEAKVQKNLITFGAYVSLFPQLIAGPIVRYRDVAEQLDGRVHTVDRFGDGVKRFVTGLGKKVLLANNIGMLWDAVSSTDPANLSAAGAWLRNSCRRSGCCPAPAFHTWDIRACQGVRASRRRDRICCIACSNSTCCIPFRSEAVADIPCNHARPCSTRQRNSIKRPEPTWTRAFRCQSARRARRQSSAGQLQHAAAPLRPP